MTSLVLQDGKLLLRDGKLATGQECCCGGVGGCCQCDGHWQIKVNGVPMRPAGSLFVYLLELLCPPSDGSCPCLKLWGVGGPDSSDTEFAQAMVPIGSVQAGDPYGIYGETFTHDASAQACLVCVNNSLVVVLGITIFSYSQTYNFWSNYSVYFSVNTSSGCSGVLSATAMETPPEGAIGDNGEGFGLDGVQRGNVVERFSSLAFYDITGQNRRLALFDASELNVTLECNPAGACCYGVEGEPQSCEEWSQSVRVVDLLANPQAFWTGSQSHCENTLGGTWNATARCADDPCNPLP